MDTNTKSSLPDDFTVSGDINDPDDWNGMLHDCVKAGRLDLMRPLFDAGLQLSHDNVYVFELAARNGRADIVDYLMQQDGDDLYHHDIAAEIKKGAIEGNDASLYALAVRDLSMDEDYTGTHEDFSNAAAAGSTEILRHLYTQGIRDAETVNAAFRRAVNNLNEDSMAFLAAHGADYKDIFSKLVCGPQVDAKREAYWEERLAPEAGRVDTLRRAIQRRGIKKIGI